MFKLKAGDVPVRRESRCVAGGQEPESALDVTIREFQTHAFPQRLALSLLPSPPSTRRSCATILRRDVRLNMIFVHVPYDLPFDLRGE